MSNSKHTAGKWRVHRANSLLNIFGPSSLIASMSFYHTEEETGINIVKVGNIANVKSESAEEVNILDKNLLFKFKDEHNTAEITLSMRDIWANVQEYVYDKLESGLPSCNCTNESNPFCECPPIYEAFELSSISMHSFANEDKKQHAIGFTEWLKKNEFKEHEAFKGYWWSNLSKFYKNGYETEEIYNEYLNTLNNK